MCVQNLSRFEHSWCQVARAGDNVDGKGRWLVNERLAAHDAFCPGTDCPKREESKHNAWCELHGEGEGGAANGSRQMVGTDNHGAGGAAPEENLHAGAVVVAPTKTPLPSRRQ